MPHKTDTDIERTTRETGEGLPHENGKPMTQKQTPNHSLQTAVDQARKLTESAPAQTGTPTWMAQAHHVGDLSVLALALRS
jgi:hypothetical protein